MRNLLPAARTLSRRTLHGFRRLTVVQWSLFHWYGVLAAWGIVLLVVPPSAPAAALGQLVDVVGCLVIFGAIASGVGAYLGAQRGTAANAGLVVETVGLTFVQAANVSYLLTQVALISAPIVGRDRIGATVYVYAVTAALFVRGLFLIRNYLHVGEPASRKVIH